MQLRDVMSRQVASVAPDTSLREAAQRLGALGLPVLAVCDGNRFVGVITPRDLIVRATARGCDPRRTTVQELMSHDAVCGFEDQPVREAAALMANAWVRHLPVVDRHRRLVGIVSLSELQANLRRAAA